MHEITRLSDGSDWIELEFVKRQLTPEFAIRLGIRMHVAGLSLSNTTSILERLGVERSRAAVHSRVQKADLQPEGGASPDHVALDETVIRINGQQYWLYAAVDPETNAFLHIRLLSTYTTVLTEIFPSELREKHDVETTVFLVDDAQWLQTALDRHGLDCRHEFHGNRNTAERIFREVKGQTVLFSNTFNHVEPTTVETWLQALAVW
ncbi:IS6 family transposase [Haloplanus natans]|uniref:IS6 family transposase n=1 Tax=Haloplanus natans TaxID=376171 RepID=UPI0009FE52D7|nr:IS6 family transposase [Haloplanus natans]